MPEKYMNIIHFKLDGLTCEACVKLATWRLKKIEGVQEVEINLSTGEAKISSEKDIDLDIIKNSLSGMTFAVAE